MKLDNISLAYLLLELNPFLEGAFVNKVSEIKTGILKIKVHSKQGSKDLILSKDGLYLTNYSLQARHGKSNFATALKKELYNKKIVSLEQHQFDRVITIKFLEHSLVMEFVGEGNMALLDSQGIIISCLKNETWADRQTKKGIAYEYPKNRAESPLDASEKSVAKAFSESKKDAIRALFSVLNISPLMAEEAFYLSKIDKTRNASELKQAEIKSILGEIKQLYLVEQKKLQPVMYGEKVAPFSLKHISEQPKKIESINSVLDETISLVMEKTETKKEEKEKKDHVSALEFQRGQQAKAQERFEEGIEANRKKAELIYSHYSELEELRSAVLIAMKKGLKEKEIMYTFNSAAQKGNKTAKLIKSIDFAKKKFEVELG